MSREKIAGFSRDAMLYGLGNTLGRIVGLVMLPILTRVFNTGDYGAIDLLSISYMFVLITMKVGIPSGLQRFYYQEEGGSRRRMVTSCAAFLFLLACVLATGVALSSDFITRALQSDVPGLRRGVVALALCMPMETIWDYSLLLLRLRRRAVVFSVFNVIRVVLTPAVTYYFVVSRGTGIEGVFYAKLLSLTLLAVGLVLTARSEWTLPLRWGPVHRVLRFALPGHPGLIIRTLMNVLPQYMLAAVAPLSAVGLFGIAFRLSNVMKVFVGSFNLAWNPFAYQNEGAADEQRLYEVAFKGFFGLMMLLGLTLALFAREVLTVLATPEFVPAAVLIPGIAIYFAVDGLTIILSTILYTRDQVRWATYLNLLRIGVFLAMGALLLPRYEAKGLVVALAGSALIYLAGYVWRARRVFPLALPWTAMVSAMAAAGGILWFFAVTEFPMWPTLGLKALALVIFAILLFAVLLQSAERRAIGELCRRVQVRKAHVV